MKVNRSRKSGVKVWQVSRALEKEQYQVPESGSARLHILGAVAEERSDEAHDAVI